MQPLSATDAIGLAFAHTRTVLAPKPFRLGRFLKLALVAAVTQASFFSLAVGYPLQGVQFLAISRMRQLQHDSFVGGGPAFAVLLAVVLGVMVLALLFTVAYLYLVARARATLFDLVVYRGARVREAWRRQVKAGRRYFGLFLLAMAAFWVVTLAVLAPFLFAFMKAARAQVQAGVSSNPAAVFTPQVFAIVGMVWLLMPVWLALDAILQDFILPGLAVGGPAASGPGADQALDGPDAHPADRPVARAFQRFMQLLRQSPGQLALFLLLRTVVAVGIALALFLVAAVALGALALPCLLVGRLLYGALWSGGLGARVVFFAVGAAAALGLALVYLLFTLAIYGVTGTFKASYAALFYSGYYPELAALITDRANVTPTPLQALPPQTSAELPPPVW